MNTVAKFGSQTQELNISLTAVGLMWNISDYFHQNQGKLSQTLTDDNSVFPDFPGTLNMANFDKLWMCLYARLGELCVDSRPAVRKSAGQTLFSMITAHGALLKQSTWQAVLWQVLFPLLDKVRSLSSSASSDIVDTGGNILIHHSRNTAQKQWAETQVLTLSGVARVFNTKRQMLQALGDFPRAWTILLEFIEYSALSKNSEVSFSALKSFQEILYNNKNQTNDNKLSNEDKDIWSIAWKVWLKIGKELTIPMNNNETLEDFYAPTQAYLIALVQIFHNIFQHVKNTFTIDDLKQLCGVLTNAVTLPAYGSTDQYIITTSAEFCIAALYDGALHAIELVQNEAISRNNTKMLPEIFKQLLIFTKFTCAPPKLGKYDVRSKVSPEWTNMNYIQFGEKAMNMLVKLYEKTATNMDVINESVLYEILAALHIPLALKYNCISNTTWKLAASSLIAVLKTGLPVARGHGNQFASMWNQLALTLNEYLFPKS